MRPAAQPPTHRPRWLVVWSVLTLLWGLHALQAGYERLRDPVGSVSLGRGIQAREPGEAREYEDARRLERVGARIAAAYPRRIRGLGIADLTIGALCAYAALAALLRDRHGRRAMMAAAVGGIALHAGGLPIELTLARAQSTEVVPVLAERARDMIADASVPDGGTGDGGAGRRLDAATQAVDLMSAMGELAFVAAPALGSAFGVACASFMLAAFAGRRGRRLYGVESMPSDGG